MKTTFPLYTFSFIALSALNCGSPLDDSAAGNDTAQGQAGFSSHIHVMPLRNPSDAPPVDDRQTQAAAKTLTNYGGPVLKNVNVIPVYWNSSVAYASNLNSFYSYIVGSPMYTSLLTQYSGIGTGTLGTPYTGTQPSSATTDAAVQTYLNGLFTSGAIPAPNANNYYPVHFPPGVTVTDSGGANSCVTWCAYHGTYVRNGVNVNYGIIPDQGGGCAGGCGSNAQRVNNLTSVTSHELVEATTDPAVGIATVYGPPLGWYNATYGEIGDICNAQQATTGGYVVQTEYSNYSRACKTTK